MMADTQMADFQTEFLQSIASALGVSYDRFRRDYHASESATVRAIRRRHELEMRLAEARWRIAWAEFSRNIYATLLYDEMPRILLGYDPQRLLPAPQS
jgi:capsid protein